MRPLYRLLLWMLVAALLRPVLALLNAGGAAGSAISILKEAVLWGLPSLLLYRQAAREREEGVFPPALLLYVPAGMAAQFALSLLTALWLRLIPAVPGPIDLPGNEAEAVLTLLAAVIMPAVCEELFFRQTLLGLLGRYLSPARALMLSSLLFALFHGSLTGFPVHLAVGILLGLCYQATGSLACCMVFHGSFNAAALVTAALQPSVGPAFMGGCTAAVLLYGLVMILLRSRRSLRPGSGEALNHQEIYLLWVVCGMALIPYLITVSLLFAS